MLCSSWEVVEEGLEKKGVGLLRSCLYGKKESLCFRDEIVLVWEGDDDPEWTLGEGDEDGGGR